MTSKTTHIHSRHTCGGPCQFLCGLNAWQGSIMRVVSPGQSASIKSSNETKPWAYDVTFFTFLVGFSKITCLSLTLIFGRKSFKDTVCNFCKGHRIGLWFFQRFVCTSDVKFIHDCVFGRPLVSVTKTDRHNKKDGGNFLSPAASTNSKNSTGYCMVSTALGSN